MRLKWKKTILKLDQQSKSESNQRDRESARWVNE